jgi:hypothetical protein
LFTRAILSLRVSGFSSDMSCTFPSFLDTKHLLDRRLIYDVGGASGLR